MKILSAISHPHVIPTP